MGGEAAIAEAAAGQKGGDIKNNQRLGGWLVVVVCLFCWL